MCTVGTARTLSAYLHRRGTASGSAMGPFTVLGRASPCSLDRGRPGADHGRRGQGSEPAGVGGFGGGLAWAFLAGDRGDLLRGGTGGGEGAARLT